MNHQVLTAVLAFTGFATSISADTITVCASGCDYTSINAAIADAENGDVIQLSAEMYTEGSVIDTDGKAIILRGTTGKDGVPTSVLNGQGNYQVIRCISGETTNTTFQDLKIKSGKAWNYSAGIIYGGGMLNESGSSPTVINCWFENNFAFWGGGGVANRSNSNPTFVGCTFKNNTARTSAGGGMFCNLGSSPQLTDCLFLQNRAGEGAGGSYTKRGGGMFCSTGSAILIDCTFTENLSDNEGGGFYHQYLGAPQLTGCTFTGNTAGSAKGGGVLIRITSSGQPSLTNCSFTGNNSGLGASGILIESSSTILSECTFMSSEDSGANTIDTVEYLPPIPVVPGDADGDGDVDSNDFVALRNQIGIETLGCLVADINGDGQVNGADLAYVLGWWGICLTP